MLQRIVQLPAADADPALREQAAADSLQQLAKPRTEDAESKDKRQEARCRLLERQLATQAEKDTLLQQQLKMQAEMVQQLKANLKLQQQFAATQISSLQQQLAAKKESNQQYKAKVNALEADNTKLRGDAAELQRQLVVAKAASNGRAGSGSTEVALQASIEQQYRPLDKDPVKELLIMLAEKERELQRARADMEMYGSYNVTANCVEGYKEVLDRGLGLLLSFKSYMGSIGPYDKVDKAFFQAVEEAHREVLIQYKEFLDGRYSGELSKEKKEFRIGKVQDSCTRIMNDLKSQWTEEGQTTDRHFWPALLAQISWDHAWVTNCYLRGCEIDERVDFCRPLAHRFDHEFRPALERFCEKYEPFEDAETEGKRALKSFDDWWDSWAKHGKWALPVKVFQKALPSDDDE